MLGGVGEEGRALKDQIHHSALVVGPTTRSLQEGPGCTSPCNKHCQEGHSIIEHKARVRHVAFCLS